MKLRRLPLAAFATCLCAGIAWAAAFQIQSFVQFPTPFSKVGSFGPAQLAKFGITGGGYNFASTGVTGNPDAPIMGAAITSSQTVPEFVFDTPRSYVGVSVADVDFTVDEAAIVSMTAYSAEGTVIGTVQRVLRPANTLSQENRTAVFLGITSTTPIKGVRIFSSVKQTTLLDNLVFEQL